MKKLDSTDFNQKLRLMAKAALVILVGFLLSKILAWAYRIIIARYYGPETYGLFSISIMLAGWLIAFSSFGLSDGILRYISFYRGKEDYAGIRRVLRFSLLFCSILSIIMGILMFLFSEYLALSVFHNPNLIFFFKAFSIAVPLSVVTQLFLSTMRAFEKIEWYSFTLNILQNVVKVSLIVLFIFFWRYNGAIAVSYLLGIVAMLIVGFYFCKYKLPGVLVKPRKKEKKVIRELFSYSWPLLFSAVIISIFGWIDTFSIAYYKDAASVGIYNVALPIAMLLGFTPFLFTQLFFPLMNREYAKGKFELIKQISQQTGKWIFALNLPVLLIFIFFPGVIINILFGAEYLSASMSLVILSFGFFFMAQSELSLHLLNTVKKSKLNLIDILAASVLNVILNSIFVPRWGIEGAAIATTISYVFYGTLLLIQARHYVKIVPVRRKMLLVLISGAVAMSVLFLARAFIQVTVLSMILSAVLFILVYLFMLFITKSMDRNDLMILSSIRNRFAKAKPPAHIA